MRDQFPRPLSEQERDVLNLLLSVDFLGVRELRLQAEHATVTGLCPCGCPTFHLTVDTAKAPQAVLRSSVPVETVVEPEDPMETTGLILFTEDGWLSNVELWWISEERPTEFPPVESYRPPKPAS